MKPPPFEYHAPSTIEDALNLAATLQNAKILAGGQSLMPMLNMRYAFPDHVIDLNLIPELAYIREDGGALKLGALTRQRAVERSVLVQKLHPILQEALGHVGHIQTRNRGTIGGSLCHLDPSAELPGVVTAICGEIEVASVRGRRSIPMAQFPAFYMTPAIDEDEIVTGVSLPLWTPGHGFAFEEFARRHGDFAVAAVSVLIELGRDRHISRAAIVLAGIGSAPVRVAAAEQFIVGRAPTQDVLAQAAAMCRDVEARADAYTSADYRRYLAGVLGGRALTRAADRARAHH